MRPEIAKLICPTFIKELIDAPSVHKSGLNIQDEYVSTKYFVA